MKSTTLAAQHDNVWDVFVCDWGGIAAIAPAAVCWPEDSFVCLAPPWPLKQA
jgi:hypothetical protein